jgi:hypothetical protein
LGKNDWNDIELVYFFRAFGIAACHGILLREKQAARALS